MLYLVVLVSFWGLLGFGLEVVEKFEGGGVFVFRFVFGFWCSLVVSSCLLFDCRFSYMFYRFSRFCRFDLLFLEWEWSSDRFLSGIRCCENLNVWTRGRNIVVSLFVLVFFVLICLFIYLCKRIFRDLSCVGLVFRFWVYRWVG